MTTTKRCLAVVLALAATATGAQERVSHGNFKEVSLYRPPGEASSFVMLLSDDDGWTPAMAALAQSLTREGAMVAGIDTPQFARTTDADGDDCSYPAGDFENLAHFVQGYARLPTYMKPVLAGRGAGASWAYAINAQAPDGAFAGTLSQGFCPQVVTHQPVCKGLGPTSPTGASTALPKTLVAARAAAAASAPSHRAARAASPAASSASRPGRHAKATGAAAQRVFELLPVTHLASPWVALHDAEARCDVPSVQRFVDAVKGARLVTATPANALPQGQPQAPAAAASASPSASLSASLSAPQLQAQAQFTQAYRSVATTHAVAALPKPPGNLGDLPLIELPAPAASSGSGDVFAVLLSGDGGWAGIDKGLAAAMTARGVPVVGLDSLRYFWSPRTPQGLARDLDRVVAYYASHWNRQRVLLIGFSQGADVLPFALNRLDPAVRARVDQTVLLGLGERASFEFHLGNWVGTNRDGLPILPEVMKLDAATSLCLYGSDDKDALCPRVPAGRMTVHAEPGDHHFNGAYEKLAGLVLARVRPR